MLKFSTTLKKFSENAEKTGWTYLIVPKRSAESLAPGVKKAFRVKGKIDHHPIKKVALLPAGNGDFILAVNGNMRKAIGKIHGAEVEVILEADKEKMKISTDLLDCLADEPQGSAYFQNLPPSHQNWFSNWVNAAGTEPTRAKRIAAIVQACSFKMSFGEMMRAYRDDKNALG